jgi:hypothetical protein
VAGVTWRRILEDYASHPERKLLDANGKPCEGWTRGLLGRRTVRVVRVEAFGRSKKGLRVMKTSEPDDEAGAALAWVRSLPAYEIAERFGYSPRMAKYLRDGVKRPSAEKMRLIIEAYRETLGKREESGLSRPAVHAQVLALRGLDSLLNMVHRMD